MQLPSSYLYWIVFKPPIAFVGSKIPFIESIIPKPSQIPPVGLATSVSIFSFSQYFLGEILIATDLTTLMCTVSVDWH